jgi:hypothetical protein
MRPILGRRRAQRFIWVMSAIAIGASIYFRGFGTSANHHDHWNRLDRHAPPADLADGSFPASDPPSTVPVS